MLPHARKACGLTFSRWLALLITRPFCIGMASATLLAAFATGAQAAPGFGDSEATGSIAVSGTRQDERLLPALEYIEDVMHRQQPDVDPSTLDHLPWRPADAALERGGVSRSQWLLRVNLINFDSEPRERVLAILHPTLDDVRMTLRCSNGLAAQAIAGDRYPLSTRPLPDRNPAFPITLPASAECTAWFVINSEDTFQFPARILDTRSYNHLVLNDYMLRGLTLGMQVLAVLLALVIAFVRREFLPWQFALAVGSQAFLILVLSDLGYTLLWGELPYLQKTLAPVAICLCWAFTGPLCLRLLPADAAHALARLVLHGTVLLACGMAGIQMISQDPAHMTLLVAICATGLLILFTITGGALLVGAADAGLVTTGILAISAGGMLEASSFLGILPFSAWLVPLHAGFIISSLLFGIALWHRLDARQHRRSTDREVDRRVAERMRTLTSTVAELTTANRRLSHLSHSDALTGAFNRHFMDIALEEYVRDADNAPLSFILFDIDFFKQVNDRHGHPVGDQCLRIVADCVQNQLRQGKDVLCRYGGEEFAVILPNTDTEGARRVAEKVRLAVERATIPCTGLDLHVTISLGVATIRHTTPPATLIDCADRALYTAKRSGRNRWQVATA